MCSLNWLAISCYLAVAMPHNHVSSVTWRPNRTAFQDSLRATRPSDQRPSSFRKLWQWEVCWWLWLLALKKPKLFVLHKIKWPRTVFPDQILDPDRDRCASEDPCCSWIWAEKPITVPLATNYISGQSQVNISWIPISYLAFDSCNSLWIWCFVTAYEFEYPL